MATRKILVVESESLIAERRYRRFFEGVGGAILVYGVNGRPLDCNKAAERLLGYERRELMHLAVADIFHPDCHGVMTEKMQKLLFDESLLFESLCRHRNGTGIAVEVNARRIDYGAEGAILAVVRDISESKRARDRLHSAKARLEFLLTNSPAVIYTCRYGGDWAATFIGENLSDVLGYEPREIYETPGFWLGRLHPNDRDRVLGGLESLVAKDLHIQEYRFRHKDGSYRWMHDRICVVRDGQGEPVECVGSWIDISERKLMEEARRLSEVRYLSIIEDQSELICRYLLDGRISFVNGAYARYYGKKPAELLGRNYMPQIPEPDLFMVLDCVRSITAAAPIVEFEHRVKMPDGAVRWQHWTHRGIYTEDGYLIEYQAVGRDITDRKQVEDDLKNAKARLEFLVFSSPAVSYTFRYGGDWAATFVSDNVKNVLGYDAREFLGSPEFWAAGIHPDDRDRILEGLKSHSIENFHAHEYRFLHKDGAFRWLDDRFRVVRDEEGRPIECVGVWIDNTERKRAEEKLQESEKRYRLLFNSGNDPVVVHRPLSAGVSGNFIEANDLACQRLGYSREELLRLSPVDIEDPADPVDMTALRDVIRRDRHVLFEGTYLTRAGRKFPVEINSRLFEWNGEPAVLSVVRDITERKRAEEKLREEQATLQTLIQAIPDVVFFKDAQSRYLMVNKAAEEFMGLTQGQVLGKTDADLLPPELAGACRVSDEMVAGTLKAARNEEQYTRADKKGFLDTIKAPVFDARGNFAGLIGVSREVTERKRVEEDLCRSREDIQRLNRELEDRVLERTSQLNIISRRLIQVQEEERRHLARELHDEVGQVLTGLKYGAERLFIELPDSRKDDGMSLVATIGELLNSVRGLSLKLRPSMLDDFGLVPALKWDFCRVEATTGLRIAFHCKGEPRRCDQHVEIALYRIAQEAITNVVRHAGVQVARVELSLGEKEAVMTVEDHGPGFLTESWNIGQDSTGLSGMSERSTLLGGSFSVDSKPGEGTRVTAVVPLNP